MLNILFKKVNTTKGTSIVYIITAIFWYGFASLLEKGNLHKLIMIILTFVFCGIYLWSIFITLQRVYSDHSNLWTELGLTIFNIFLFLLVFAGVQYEIGVIDTTLEGNPITQDFWACLYYSIITFTSTGYGDFVPQGVGRVLASLQVLVGYLVLGLMASTSMSVIQWRAKNSIGNNSSDNNSGNASDKQNIDKT